MRCLLSSGYRFLYGVYSPFEDVINIISCILCSGLVMIVYLGLSACLHSVKYIAYVISTYSFPCSCIVPLSSDYIGRVPLAIQKFTCIVVTIRITRHCG